MTARVTECRDRPVRLARSLGGDAPANSRVHLAECREKFTRVFAQSHDMIVIADPAMDRFVDVNPSACALLEYRRDELLAVRPSAIHTRSLPRFQAFVESVLEEGSGWTDEIECITKSGRGLPTEISASRIELDGRPCILAMVRDQSERKRAEQQVSELSKRILAAQEAERRRVARELHDSVNQLLSSAKFRLQCVADGIEAPHDRLRECAVEAQAVLENAMQEVRRISQNLRPSELDDLGLVPAVRNMCEAFSDRTGIEVALSCSRIGGRIDPDAELAFYRIVQEALTNVEKHSEATRVDVRVGRRAETVYVRVADNGVGLSRGTSGAGDHAGGGLGLDGMRERAALAGGTVTVTSVHGGGTEIAAQLPAQPMERVDR